MPGLDVKASYIQSYLELGDDVELSGKRVEEANDWLERQFAQASVPLPVPTDPPSLAFKSAQRATAAYFAYLQARKVNVDAGQDAERVQRLKDGDTDITFAPLDAAVARQSANDWLMAARQYLIDAGLPRLGRVFPGASR